MVAIQLQRLPGETSVRRALPRLRFHKPLELGELNLEVGPTEKMDLSKDQCNSWLSPLWGTEQFGVAATRIETTIRPWRRGHSQTTCVTPLMKRLPSNYICTTRLLGTAIGKIKIGTNKATSERCSLRLPWGGVECVRRLVYYHTRPQ